MNLKSVVTFVAACTFFAGLLCSDWENPYLNKSKSSADVLKKTFSDKDTIDIFSKESLSVVIYLKEHVAAFRVNIEKNRLWDKADSLIIADKFGDEPFLFTFSFYDTGWHYITLSTIYNDNTKKDKKYSLYVKSPLSQKRVEMQVGDSVLLETDPVKDNDVFYVWNFGETVITSEKASVQVKMDRPLTSPEGELYVEDRDKVFRSPSFLFPVMVNKELLEMKCENSPIFRDTVYVQTKTFTFTVKVKGAQELVNAKINGEEFDERIKNSDGSFLLNKTFHDLDILTEPMEIHVFCENEENATIDNYFYLKYKSQITVLYPEDESVNVGESSLLIYGTISDYFSFDTVALLVKNNGEVQDHKIMTGENEWQFTLVLDEGWNDVVLELYEDSTGKGTLLARTERHINYSLGMADTASPQIVSIKSEGIDLYDGFINRSETLPVELLVIDNGKTDSVTVNNRICSVSDNGIKFNIDIDLVHDTSGNSLSIKAIDSSGNESDTVINVYYNRMPQFDSIPQLQIITADSVYTDTIEVSDEDGDSLQVSAKFKKGEKDTVIKIENKIFEWTPDPSNSGLHEIVLEVYDGYETVQTSFLLFVLETEKDPVPVKWSINEEDIYPKTLLVGTDTLKVEMKIHSQSGTPPFNFTVYCGDDIIYQGDDNNLEWVPTAQHVGAQNLRLIVEDSLGSTDILEVLLTVVKPPAAYVNWEKTSLSFEEGENIGVIRAVLSDPVNDTVRIPFSIDWSASHAGDSDFKFEDTVLVFEPGSKIASTEILISDDEDLEGDELFVLFLTGSDSIHTGPRHIFTGTIIDNDQISFSFSNELSSGSEGDERVTIPVELSEEINETVVLYCSIDPSSTAGPNDFSMPDSIQFSPGETLKNLVLTVIDDTIPEDSETVVIHLKAKDNVLIPGEITTHIYTIISNEREVYFENTVYTGTEDWSGNHHGRICVSSNMFTSLDVYFEIDHNSSSADSGKDYLMHTNNKVSFGDLWNNEQCKSIGFEFLNDDRIENTERVVIKITGVSDYKKAYIGRDSIMTIFIEEPNR